MVVIGADGRKYQSNHLQYPGRTFVWNDMGCTAKLIGPSTMVTAAHCVHTGRKWKYSPNYYPGPDGNKPPAQRYPFGYYSCYRVTIPAGWGSSRKVAHDYAVVDLSYCNVSPGRTLGWLGIGSFSSSYLDGRGAHLFGFPADKYPYPAIWGMGGKIETSGWYPARLFYRIDTAGGQSGSGVYVTRSDGGRYIVGIHSGGFSSKENQARRVNGTVMGFLRKYSSDL